MCTKLIVRANKLLHGRFLSDDALFTVNAIDKQQERGITL
jgi:hypothetical protein